MEPETTPALSARDAWAHWHRLREEGLAAEFGWLTLTSYQWLPAEPGPLELLPGRFAATESGAVFEPVPGGEPVFEYDADAPLSGPVTRALGEGESVYWLRATDAQARETVVELGVRGGRYMVRTRERRGPVAEAFGGVPTFDYNPAWVVAGRFQRFAEPKAVTVGSYRPDTRLPKELAGELVFEMPAGMAHRVAVEENHDGSLTLAFHDASNGESTPAWRFVSIPAPAEDGSVTIDFNRTLLYPFAFSEHAVCPMPPAGNSLDFAVNAGEKLAPAED